MIRSTSAEPFPIRATSGTIDSECVYQRWTASVSAGRIGFRLYGLLYGTLSPAVKISAAVSPKMRPATSTTPVVSRPIALGSTTRVIVCHFVPPSAIDASRIVSGTLAKASCVTRISDGRLSRVSVSAPPSAVKCHLKR
jgi:hypothetical protein